MAQYQKGASPKKAVTADSVEFDFLGGVKVPVKWVFPILWFSSCVFLNYSLLDKPGGSDHLIQDWWNWAHGL